MQNTKSISQEESEEHCMVRIQKVYGCEILDSRGNPTVSATAVLTDGTTGLRPSPSGASTGKFEAVELRDGDQRRYWGQGGPQGRPGDRLHHLPRPLEKVKSLTLREIDGVLQKLDGTPNKAHLGANATLAVSMACARALAAHYRMPLFRFLGGAGAHQLPLPMMNILNGGAHAGNNIDIQEFNDRPGGGGVLPGGAAVVRGDLPHPGGAAPGPGALHRGGGRGRLRPRT